VVLQPSSKITYCLGAGDGRNGVSGWFYSHPARSRTTCGRVMGDMESAGGSTVIQQDHVRAVGGRERRSVRVVLQSSSKITYTLWAGDGRYSERAVLQPSSKITYSLWVGNGRDGVSGWFRSHPGRLRTGFGRAMGETESAGGSIVILQDQRTSCGQAMRET
jgi:hypothetical protein